MSTTSALLGSSLLRRVKERGTVRANPQILPKFHPFTGQPALAAAQGGERCLPFMEKVIEISATFPVNGIISFLFVTA